MATPHRTVRIADHVWEPAQERAAENSETVTDVVRRALTEYVTLRPPVIAETESKVRIPLEG